MTDAERIRTLEVLLREAVTLLDDAIDRGPMRAEWDDVAELFVKLCNVELDS